MIDVTDLAQLAQVTMTSLLLEAAVKVSLVLLIALAVVWCLQRRSAAARHWVLSVAIVCALVVPVLSTVAPTWHLPVTAGWPLASAGSTDGVAAELPSPTPAASPAGAASATVTLFRSTTGTA